MSAMSGPFRRVFPGCRLLIRQHLGQADHVGKRSFFMRPGGHWDPFSEMQTSVREMERNFQRLERDMDNMWNRVGLQGFFPTFARRIPLQTTGQSGNTHKIDLDLTGYKPEDVKVTLKDRVVTVDAKLEEIGSDGSRLYQETSRKFTLPEEVDIESLKSLFSTEDGILTIEAPYKNPPKLEKGPTEIPINRSESDSK